MINKEEYRQSICELQKKHELQVMDIMFEYGSFLAYLAINSRNPKVFMERLVYILEEEMDRFNKLN